MSDETGSYDIKSTLQKLAEKSLTLTVDVGK